MVVADVGAAAWRTGRVRLSRVLVRRGARQGVSGREGHPDAAGQRAVVEGLDGEDGAADGGVHPGQHSAGQPDGVLAAQPSQHALFSIAGQIREASGYLLGWD